MPSLAMLYDVLRHGIEMNSDGRCIEYDLALVLGRLVVVSGVVSGVHQAGADRWPRCRPQHRHPMAGGQPPSAAVPAVPPNC